MGEGSNPIVLVVYLVFIVVLMYFMFIRPNKKKKKEEEKLRNSIQVGDELLTIGGFYVKVISVKDDTLIVESKLDHSKNEIANWAIQKNLTVHDETPEK